MNRTAQLSLTAAALAAATIAIAGTLNPPAGVIQGTMKTLGEVEPRTSINTLNTPGDADSVYRIVQSGSYYLVGNINVNGGRAAIEVAAPNVEIDLNGFQISGSGEGGPDTGVSVPSGVTDRVRVRNGSIRNCGTGVDAGPRAVVENVTIRDCGVGIVAAQQSVVRDSNVFFCAGVGIQVGDDSSVDDCAADSNQTGILAGNDCTITGVTVSGNTVGMNVADRCSIIACNISQNTNTGVFADDKTLIRECNVSNNGNGLEIDGFDSSVIDNIISDNSGFGVFVANRSTLRGNNVTSNGGSGLFGSSGLLVENNNFDENGIGASVVFECVVRNNSFRENTTALQNFNGTGDNTIDENTFIRNDTALEIAGDNNLVTRNFFARNTATLNVTGSGNSFGNLPTIPGNAAAFDNIVY